ncbi:MAG: hypothetical protein RIM72_12610 [Alphaproteobacteria bacterium]
MSYRFASDFPPSVTYLTERFGHSDLASALDRLCRRHLGKSSPAQAPPPDSSVLVVRTANHPWEVLSEASLELLFPNRRKPCLFFMPKGYAWSGGYTGDVEAEVVTTADHLIQAIGQINPHSLYLQVGPHTKSEFLAGLITARFPALRLIVEFYDMSCFFSDTIQRDVRDCTAEDIEDSWAGIAAALTLADDVIVKAGGDDWLRFSETAAARCHTFFPMLDNAFLIDQGDAARRAWKPADAIRVLFGGAVTASELEHGPERTPGANFLRYFEAIGRSENCAIDVFNAADRGDGEGRFATLRSWCAGFDGKVRYHPAIGQADLLARHSSADFGFFCVHYPEDPVEHVGRMAIPNRMMTHVCGGVPVIVDDRAALMADLVRRFDAGVVIDPADLADLPNLVAGRDMATLRAGIQEMKSWMLSQNQVCLDALRMVHQVPSAIHRH